MNEQKKNNLPSIITDSFLRSYSISRIVKINEENRNKAKFAIMRKIKTLKQQNRNKSMVSRQQRALQNISTLNRTNINALKEQLNIIENGDFEETPLLRKKESCRRECRQLKSSKKKTHQSHKSKIFASKNELQQNRMNSTVCQGFDNALLFKQNPSKIKDLRHLKMKTQLRLKNITFSKNSTKKRKLNQFCNQEGEPDQNISDLFFILNNFNRIKLLANAKSSQNIMKHLYKRSLQQCSLDEIEYLVKMQKNKQDKGQMSQNKHFIPMRFDKPSSQQKKFGQLSEVQFCKKNQQKTVWKNEIIKKNCLLNEKQSTINDRNKNNLSPGNQSLRRDIKSNTMNKINRKFNKGQKQNFREEQLFSQINSNSVELQKSLMYYYQGKRFPLNENKLNGVYRKWNMQLIKKRRTHQQNNDIQNNEIHPNIQLGAKSIQKSKNSQQNDITIQIPQSRLRHVQ